MACYLLREDGEWYELGDHARWSLSFAVFPGGADGSLALGLEDAGTLALRLEGYDYESATLERLAVDIIRWANEGKDLDATWIDARRTFRFVTELSPEVELDVRPAPITGSALSILGSAASVR